MDSRKAEVVFPAPPFGDTNAMVGMTHPDFGQVLLAIEGCHLLRVWDSGTFDEDPVLEKVQWRGIYEDRWLYFAPGTSSAPEHVRKALNELCPRGEVKAFYAGWARFCILMSANLDTLCCSENGPPQIRMDALIDYARVLIVPALRGFRAQR